MAADSVLKRIPYFNRIYSDKHFQTTESFKAFASGVRKTFSKTIFRSAVEGRKEMSIAERKAFGEKGLGNKRPPDVEKMIKERQKQQAKNYEKSWLKKANDLLFGKDVPPNVQSMR